MKDVDGLRVFKTIILIIHTHIHIHIHINRYLYGI